jgi:hypothetical protein
MSEKKKAANRRNSKRSTGPRTAEGKVNSSQNAVTHGLTARRPIIDGEDPEQYDNLRKGLLESFAPRGALETELVDTLVGLFWRLRRIPALENALFVWLEHVQDREYDSRQALQRGFINSRSFARESGEEFPSPDEFMVQVTGRTIEALLKTDLQGKLTRHEMALRRQVSQVWKELRQLQAERRQLEKARSPVNPQAPQRSHLLVVGALTALDEPPSADIDGDTPVARPSSATSDGVAASGQSESPQPSSEAAVSEELVRDQPWWAVKGAYG